MSTPIPHHRQRDTVPANQGFNLNTSRITIGEKYTNVRIPIDVWNDEVELEQKKLNSLDTKIDPKAVAERMSVKIVRTAAVQTLVSQPDPRDKIPLVYSSKTRKIIYLVGFFLSSSAILGVHIAGNEGHVPGFQPLPMFTANPSIPYNPSNPPPPHNLLLGMAFGALTIVGTICGALYIPTR
jgi:hypothetical protein